VHNPAKRKSIDPASPDINTASGPGQPWHAGQRARPHAYPYLGHSGAGLRDAGHRRQCTIAADRAAIIAIVQDSSASKPNPHVAPNLDWEDAFGVRYTDLKKREAFYAAVVAPLQKNDTGGTLEIKVKFIKPDIAVADEYWREIGQLDVVTRKPGPDRWGRTTYFFTRNAGQWTEILERVADLRYAYYHHYETLPVPVPVRPSILAHYAGTYIVTDDHTTRKIAVEGDQLMITSAKGIRVGIPVSSTDFLEFNPEDLAEYKKLHFATDAKNRVAVTVSEEIGETLRTLAKAN